MSNARIVNKSQSLAKVRTTNATDTSFASKVPTTTEPTGEGVVSVRAKGVVPEAVVVYPYGTGDADDVFDMKVLGWRKVGTLWIPVPLVTLTCTLGAGVGVSGAAVTDSEKFCDTVTAAGGISNVSYQLFSPTGDLVAHALVWTNGCDKLEFIFDATTGSPTGMNALWAPR